MATSIRLIRRYVWLVDTIKRAGSITLKEINRKWANNSSINIDKDDEIPERTFHRHREAIAELFDIDIRCNRYDGNKYYIENEDQLDNPSFNSWLFKGLALDNQMLGNRELSERIVFEEALGGYDYLSPIIEALSNHRTISLHYKRFNDDITKELLVEPTLVKQSNRRWYLIGKVVGGVDSLIFALDRITSLQITDQTFAPSETGYIKNRFDEVIGVNLDADYDCEKVVIKVFGSQRAYVDSLPLHKSQRRIDHSKEWAIYELTVRPEYVFQHELLRMGPHVEVISPLWLRDEIKWLGEEIVKRYEQK